MADTKGSIGPRNYACSGKQPYLPPISPIPTTSSPYSEFWSNTNLGFDGYSSKKGESGCHQRTSSESILFEEQPSWLDDLLDEPEIPMRKGSHRRSSSDSFAFNNDYSISFNLETNVQGHYKSKATVDYKHDQAWDLQHAHYGTQRPKNKGKGKKIDVGTNLSNLSNKDEIPHVDSEASGSTNEPDNMGASETKKQEQHTLAPQKLKGPERSESSQSKQSQPESDQKRMKQQFAQRSRVRKLQYIAELERTVQALQAEGSEFSAELQFLDQQNVILSLENETLRQRLDSVAQEHLIKQFQQEMLEREIARLRSFFLQQQNQQQPPARAHRHNGSRDLDSQLANLSLKNKEANTPRDSVAAALRI